MSIKYITLVLAFTSVSAVCQASNPISIKALESVDQSQITQLSTIEKNNTRGLVFIGNTYNSAIYQARRWCRQRGTSCYTRGWYDRAEAISYEKGRTIRRAY